MLFPINMHRIPVFVWLSLFIFMRGVSASICVSLHKGLHHELMNINMISLAIKTRVSPIRISTLIQLMSTHRMWSSPLMEGPVAAPPPADKTETNKSILRRRMMLRNSVHRLCQTQWKCAAMELASTRNRHQRSRHSSCGLSRIVLAVGCNINSFIFTSIGLVLD